MKSPKDMRIIQIDVTNACIHHCSNCTRFCGHHKKNFFMDFETFKRAVDSLDGYVGTIGIMGGEPTLNPEFPKMAEYLASKKPAKHTDKMLRPQKHFMDGIHDLEFEHTFLHPCDVGMRQTVDGPGLWATTGANYKKYYEIIQDTMQYQALNDHSNVMYHQPALISRKSLGIQDEKWYELRDNCWVQNLWSASITPKGAFFCEIAAALDMLFDGPGGWPIEDGWWKRTPDQFGDQLNWCELCGLACETFMRNANEEVYDVSPDIYEKLKEIGSKEIGTSHINVVKIENGIIAEESKAEMSKRYSSSMPYTESYSARFDEKNTVLTYKELVGIIKCVDNTLIQSTIHNMGYFAEIYLATNPDIIAEIKKLYTGNAKVHYYDINKNTIGYVLYEALKKKDYNRYALYLEGNIEIRNVISELEHLVLNPGTLLISDYSEKCENDYFAVNDKGMTALINGIANSIRDAGWDRILKFGDVSELKAVWQKNKIFDFSPEIVYEAPSVDIVEGKKYVVYGAGNSFGAAVSKIIKAGGEVVAVVDSSSEKWGKDIQGYKIENPDEFFSREIFFDFIMIGSGIYYRDIKAILLKKGFKESQMSWI